MHKRLSIKQVKVVFIETDIAKWMVFNWTLKMVEWTPLAP